MHCWPDSGLDVRFPVDETLSYPKSLHWWQRDKKVIFISYKIATVMIYDNVSPDFTHKLTPL